MKKTVFISSTYRDLQPHRNQIWKVLQNFDINITGMEAFGARQSTPLETCIKELQASDIYIGIISLCYGSVDDITGKSYTQIEYEKAKEFGLEVLIYLIDERNGEIKTGNIDYGEKQLRLESFKKVLKKNHTIDFFNNEIELGQKIFNRLAKIIPQQGLTIERPKELYSKVFRINLGNEKWIVFISFLNGKAFEIFSGLADDEDGILIPRFVIDGKLILEEEDGIQQFSFQYVNKRGYKTTIVGINYLFDYQINTYDKLISKLLQSNVDLDIVISVINEMAMEHPEKMEWNKKIVQILEKPHVPNTV
ncbi:DUF4062 domain-containing protein [Polaribacter staleyi]|uniref:DUF4062 domain-containing protein n=1 Tax=Polaribacter staleyi TaxID=2022337 RepID=UPI0031BBAC86